MFQQRSFRILISLLAVGCFLFVGKNYLGQVDRIAEANWLGVVAMAIVHLVTLWLQALTIKWGLDSFKQTITQRESFTLFTISSYANLLIPRSGVGTTAVYLNRARKTSLVDFSSVVLFNTALFVLACSAFGTLLIATDWVSTGQQSIWWMSLGLPTLFVLSCVAVGIKWKLPTWYKLPGKSFLQRFSEANSRLALSKQALMIGLMHFVLALLRALRLYIAFWALGIDVSFAAVLLTSILGDLAFVIAITPGAIGFREAAIALTATKLGVSVPLAISVAVFDRLVFSMTVVILAQLMLAFVIGKTKPTTPIPAEFKPNANLKHHA